MNSPELVDSVNIDRFFCLNIRKRPVNGHVDSVLVRSRVSVQATHLDELADCLSAKHIMVSALDLIKVRTQVYARCTRVH